MNEELPNEEESQSPRPKVLPRATKTVRFTFTNNPMREEHPDPEHQELEVIRARIDTLRVQQEALLKNNPMLRGLAPLYQDYEAHFYYFEVIQFVVTLFLVAVAASLPIYSGSALFLGLVVSGGMLIALYGWKPYISDQDNRIAFIVQMVITLTFCLGLLSLSAADEDDEDSKDWAFGWILVFLVMFALLIPLGLMLLVGFRIILLMLNDGKLPWWLKFIYKKAKATVRNTQSWLRGDPEYGQKALQEIQLTDVPKPQQEIKVEEGRALL